MQAFSVSRTALKVWASIWVSHYAWLQINESATFAHQTYRFCIFMSVCSIFEPHWGRRAGPSRWLPNRLDPTSPDAVMIDSQVIANTPVRFLVAGMGDALGTYFEAARPCAPSRPASRALASPARAWRWQSSATRPCATRVIVRHGLQPATAGAGRSQSGRPAPLACR
jgi:hypothetical protein